MEKHYFVFVLDRKAETAEDFDRLYAHGCDDGAFGFEANGVPVVEFDREAPTREEAVHSALSDVEKAGFKVVKICGSIHEI